MYEKKNLPNADIERIVCKTTEMGYGEGFVTSKHRFVKQREAEEIAKKCSQDISFDWFKKK